MDFSLTHSGRSRRAGALAATLAVHVLILSAMYFSRAMPEQVPAGRSMLVWFPEPKRKEPEPVIQVVPRPAPAPVAERPRPAVTPVAVVPPAAPPVTVRVAEPAPEDAAPLEATPPAVSAADILSRARSDIGSIDRAMRKEIPKGLVRAPVMTPQKRLEKGIALANELAPPKWYEAPKITELIDPGGYGKKRYRVVTAKGTYCLTYNNSRGTGGADPFRDRPPPPMTNCDPKEQPPTTQP